MHVTMLRWAAVVGTGAAAVHGQEQQWLVQLGSRGSDIGRSSAPDGLGGGFVAGWTTGDLQGSNQGGDDVFLARYDSAGSLLWVRQFGSSVSDVASAAALDAVGGVFIGGWTDGLVADEPEGGRDAFVARYDGAGSQLWIGQGGSVVDDEINGLAPDNAGGVIACGTTWGDFASPNEGGCDVFVLRIDADNNPLTWVVQIGSSQDDLAEGVATDEAGSVFVAGSTSGDLGGDNLGEDDAFIARLTTAGEQMWIRQFGGPESDRAHQAAINGAGGVFVVGDTRGDLDGTNAGERDVFVAHYDVTGAQLWLTQFGTPAEDGAIGAFHDGSGGVFVVGVTQGDLGAPNAGGQDAFVAHLNGAGVVQSMVQLGTSEDDACAGATLAGPDLMVCGFTAGDLGAANAGEADAWVGLFAPGCTADANGDGRLNILDFVAFQQQWLAQAPNGDCNSDGAYDVLDFVCFQAVFVAGCG